jgi:hypothetical protein
MFRRLSCTAVAVLAALAATAAPAAATGPLGQCPIVDLSLPFLPWLDLMPYVPAPGGGMEPGEAPWQLAAGATVVEGNEPFYRAGATDHQSLRLAPGSSAASAAMCIGVDHPSLRFFARRVGGLPTDTLRVDVVVTDPAGEQHALPVGEVLNSGRWVPTSPLPILVGPLSTLTGAPSAVSFQFTPRGSAQWTIDDVFVDPFRTG